MQRDKKRQRQAKRGTETQRERVSKQQCNAAAVAALSDTTALISFLPCLATSTIISDTFQEWPHVHIPSVTQASPSNIEILATVYISQWSCLIGNTWQMPWAVSCSRVVPNADMSAVAGVSSGRIHVPPAGRSLQHIITVV